MTTLEANPSASVLSPLSPDELPGRAVGSGIWVVAMRRDPRGERGCVRQNVPRRPTAPARAGRSGDAIRTSRAPPIVAGEMSAELRERLGELTVRDEHRLRRRLQ